MTLSRTIPFVVNIAVLVLLTGCASPRAFIVPEHIPDDFSLGVTVFAIDQTPADHALVPARYLVEPNTTLRASIGPGSTPSTYPRRTRQLDTGTYNDLYDSIRTLDPNGSNPDTQIVDSPETYAPPVDHAVYLFEIRSGGIQRAFAIRTDNQSARSIVAELADLAWVRDQ